MKYIEYKGVDHVFRYWGTWTWWLLGIYMFTPVLVYLILPYFGTKRFSGNRKSISIFVLGDLGHSPRMCYHARSFAKLDYLVTLCGYMETEPSAEILDDENIDITPIRIIKNDAGLPFLLFAIKKVCIQVLLLLNMLFDVRGTDFILIQNPPSLPILSILIVFIKLFSRDTKLVIDWHNLNYTILNLKYNNLNHPLVRILKAYEKYLGRLADLNITVTHKMSEFLIKEFGFKKSRILTLHDRPSEHFEPLSSLGITKEEVFRNHEIFDNIKNISNYKVLVSSTSFTPDEDFNILLDALKKYETASDDLHPILLIITGKGPLKEQFFARVREMKFSEKCLIKSAWFSAEDYPIILAVADLAISLHTSSSGIDLPMKIVDFFGCGIPVISLKFPAIDELVKDGVNGLICKDSKDDLVKESDKVYCLLTEAFTDSNLLNKLKTGALAESKVRWDDNWSQKMYKYFNHKDKK